MLWSELNELDFCFDLFELVSDESVGLVGCMEERFKEQKRQVVCLS